MRGIVYMSTPHPKANDVATCDRLNLIVRTLEVPLQKCIVFHEEMKSILDICGQSARAPGLDCPTLVGYEIVETRIKYSGWFGIKSKSKKLVSSYPYVSFVVCTTRPGIALYLSNLHELECLLCYATAVGRPNTWERTCRGCAGFPNRSGPHGHRRPRRGRTFILGDPEAIVIVMGEGRILSPRTPGTDIVYTRNTLTKLGARV